MLNHSKFRLYAITALLLLPQVSSVLGAYGTGRAGEADAGRAPAGRQGARAAGRDARVQGQGAHAGGRGGRHHTSHRRAGHHRAGHRHVRHRHTKHRHKAKHKPTAVRVPTQSPLQQLISPPMLASPAAPAPATPAETKPPVETPPVETPSGPVPPGEVAAPKIGGVAEEGQTLTASTGAWTGEPTSYAYQWQDCDSSGESCVDVVDATGSTYGLMAADVGHTVRVVVTATNACGSNPATSAATAAVVAAPPPPQAPTNTELPEIGGVAEEGQTLSASTGAWTGEPTSYAYQWEECDTAGESCAGVSGATKSTYELGSSDVGHTVRVVVTATNAGGSTEARSAASATVVAEPPPPPPAPVNTALPEIGGTAEEGQTLTASKGTWTGEPTSYAYQWEECDTAGGSCAGIGGATSASYELLAGDVGHTVRVVVTATNAGGSTKASSEQTPIVVAQATSGPQIYVSQAGAGARSGESCDDARSLEWLSSESDWGSGTGKVGPGTTVDLCGTLTEPVVTRGNGSAGEPITIRFTAGAKIAIGGVGCPGSGCIYVANNSQYITIDGGTNDARGVIENTERSYARDKEEGPPTTGVVADGCRHCTIENLEIGPLYIAEKGDVVGNTELRGIEIDPEQSTPEYISIDDDVFHDLGWAVNVQATETSSHIYVEHDVFYHLTHGFTPGANFSGGDVGPVVFAHNHFYGNLNWEDGQADTNHVDGVHCFAGDEHTPHYNGLFIYDNYIATEGWNTTGPIFLEGSNSHTPCADETSNIWIFNNVLTGDTCCGLAGAFAGTPHIFNNTLIGQSSEYPEEPCETFSSDPSVKLVVQDIEYKNDITTTCKVLLSAERQLIAANGMEHNLWANASPSSNEAFVCEDPARHEYLFSEYSAWTTCLGGESDSITAGSAHLDLKDAVGELGRPESDSAAIGHGANLTSLCPDTPEEALCRNILGESRPGTGAWNIGAY